MLKFKLQNNFVTNFALAMRAITFYISLFVLLISGGNSYCVAVNQHSNTHSSTQHFHKNHKSTLSHKNHVGTLTNNVDFDLEDDFSANDDVKTVGKNKFDSLKDKISFSSFLSDADLLSLNQSSKRFKNTPYYCGLSTPIYISLRVLRI